MNPILVGKKPQMGLGFELACIVLGGDSPITLEWKRNKNSFSPSSDSTLYYEIDSSDRTTRSHDFELCFENLTDPNARRGDTIVYEEVTDQKISVKNFGDRYSVLRFSTLCPRHSGSYSCEARNAYGTTSMSTKVQVMGE